MRSPTLHSIVGIGHLPLMPMTGRSKALSGLARTQVTLKSWLIVAAAAKLADAAKAAVRRARPGMSGLGNEGVFDTRIGSDGKTCSSGILLSDEHVFLISTLGRKAGRWRLRRAFPQLKTMSNAQPGGRARSEEQGVRGLGWSQALFFSLFFSSFFFTFPSPCCSLPASLLRLMAASC